MTERGFFSLISCWRWGEVSVVSRRQLLATVFLFIYFEGTIFVSFIYLKLNLTMSIWRLQFENVVPRRWYIHGLEVVTSDFPNFLPNETIIAFIFARHFLALRRKLKISTKVKLSVIVIRIPIKIRRILQYTRKTSGPWPVEVGPANSKLFSTKLSFKIIFFYKNTLAYCWDGDSVFSPTCRSRGSHNVAKNQNGKHRKSLKQPRRPKRLKVHGHGSLEAEIDQIPTDRLETSNLSDRFSFWVSPIVLSLYSIPFISSLQ